MRFLSQRPTVVSNSAKQIKLNINVGSLIFILGYLVLMAYHSRNFNIGTSLK